MGTPEPRWIRVWADDIAAGDLIKFQRDGDAIRVLDRTRPAWPSLAFRIRLGDDDTTTGLSKTAQVFVFDPDGSVTNRVRVVLPEDNRR